MDVKLEVRNMLDNVLHLGGRALEFKDETVLLGGVPELDSMAVVALITEFEERFGFMVEDDEIDGAVFATLGSLTEFVATKLAANV